MKNIVIYSILFLLVVSCSNKKDKSDAYGTFESTEVNVSTEVSGKIIQLKIEEGNVINSESIVGIIDTVDLSLKREQLYAQKKAIGSKMENIEAQVEVQKQQKENILVEKNRIESLIKDNAATKKQLDDIEGNLKLIDKQINLIEVQKSGLSDEADIYNKQIAQITESIKKCYIKNPINGTVLNKYAQPGEVTSISKPLYKIADISKMYLRVYISAEQLSKVKIGQKVEVLVDKRQNSQINTIISDNMQKFEGTVSWISTTAEFTPKIIQTKEERVNLVYAVKILVINDGFLKIGMPGEANF